MAEDWHQLDDETLMAALAKGELAPLGELYRRYVPMVGAALRQFAPHIGDAEVDDLSQEVFLSLRDSARHYAEQSKFKAWLFGIAVQKARNWKKKGSTRGRLMRTHGHEARGQGAPSPERMVAAREIIRKKLAKLPKGQRDVLVLREVEGFCAREIGEILHLSEPAVWTRLHRARRALLKAARKERGIAASLDDVALPAEVKS